MSLIKSIVKANAAKYNFAVTISSIESVTQKFDTEEFNITWARADKGATLLNFKMKTNAKHEVELYQFFECYGKFTKTRNQLQKKKLNLQLNQVVAGKPNAIFKTELEMSNYIKEGQRNEVKEKILIKSDNFSKINNASLVVTVITWPETMILKEEEKKPKEAIVKIKELAQQAAAEASASSLRASGSFRPGRVFSTINETATTAGKEQELQNLREENIKLLRYKEDYKKLKVEYATLQADYEELAKKSTSGVDDLLAEDEEEISNSNNAILDEGSKEKVAQLEKELEELKNKLLEETKLKDEAALKFAAQENENKRLLSQLEKKQQENVQLTSDVSKLRHQVSDLEISASHSSEAFTKQGIALEAKTKQVEELTASKNKLEQQVNQIKDEKKKLDAQIVELNDKIKSEKIQYDTLANAKTAIEKAQTEAQAEVKKLQDQLHSHDLEKTASEKKVREIQTQLDISVMEVQKMKKQIDEQNSTIVNLQVQASSGGGGGGSGSTEALKKNLETINKLEQKVTDHETTIQKLNKENESLKSSSKTLEDKLREIQSKKAKSDSELEAKVSNYFELDGKVKMLTVQVGEYEKTVSKQKEEISKLTQELTKAQQQVKASQQIIEEGRQQLVLAQEENNVISQKRNEFANKIKTLQSNISDLETTITKHKKQVTDLEKEVSMHQSTGGVDTEILRKQLRDEQARAQTLTDELKGIKRRLKEQIKKNKALRTLNLDYVLNGPKTAEKVTIMPSKAIQADPIRGLRRGVGLVVEYFEDKVNADQEGNVDFKAFGDATKYPELLNLLNSQFLEALVEIFKHEFISPYWFKTSHFWQFFEEIAESKEASPTGIKFRQAVATAAAVVDQLLETNEELKKELPYSEKEMKFRSFVLYALNKGELSTMIKFALSYTDVLARFYNAESVLRQQDFVNKKLLKYLGLISKLPIYAPIDAHVEQRLKDMRDRQSKGEEVEFFKRGSAPSSSNSSARTSIDKETAEAAQAAVTAPASSGTTPPQPSFMSSVFSFFGGRQ